MIKLGQEVKFPPVLIKVGILGLALFIIFLPGISKYNQLREERQKNQQRLEELQETNIRLKEEKHMLESDPVYVEGKAREKLGFAKEGEFVIKFEEE